MADIHSIIDDTIIAGTSGADSISNDGSNVTIVGGKGDDKIYLSSYKSGGNIIKYASGDGNDIVQNLRTNDLIHITNGSYTTQVSGNDVIIKVGKGKITLKDSANIKLQIKNSKGKIKTINPDGVLYLDNSTSNTVISGTDHNDTIHNRTSNVTINSGYGNDSIMNWGGSSDTLTLIDTGYGNDEVWNYASQVTVKTYYGNDNIRNWGDNATLSAEDGDDYVWNNAKQTTISGGYGDDYIYNGASQVTINAGSGSDTIDVSADSDNVIQYALGDGYDVVYGANFNDLIHITNGTYSTWTSGDHLVVEFDYGWIVLANAANKKLKIKNSYGNIDIVNPYGAVYTKNHLSDTTIFGSYYADTIYNDVANVTINSGYGDDFISNSAVYDKKTYKPLPSRTVINSGDGNDRISNSGHNSTISASAGNDTVSNYGNYTSISSGEGNDSIGSFGNNVTINSGTGDDAIELYGRRIGVYEFAYSCSNLIQYASGDGNDTVQGFASTDLIHITNGSYTTQVSGNDIIVEVGDGKITLKDSANIKLQIKNSEGKIKTINSNGKVFIRNNISKKKIIGSDYADTINNAASKVTVSAGVGDDTIHNDYSASQTVIDGGNGNDYIDNNAKNVKIDGGTGNDKIYSANSQVTIIAGSGNDYISNYDEHNQGYSKAKIDSGSGNDTIRNGFFNQVTINAGKGNDNIYTSGDKVSIFAGSGNDTIEVGLDANYTTIKGGSGKDVFNVNLVGYGNQNFTGHSNVIEDYETGKDVVQLSNASLTSYLVNNSDVVLNLKSEHASNYKITLKNASGKKITLKDSKGKTSTITPQSSSNIFSEVEFTGLTKDEKTAIKQKSLNGLESLIANIENFLEETEESTFKMIGTVDGFKGFNSLADICRISKQIVKLCKEETFSAQWSVELEKAMQSLIKLGDDTLKLKNDTLAKDLKLGLISSVFGLDAALIAATTDGMEDSEADEVVRNIFNVAGEAIKLFAPDNFTKPFGKMDVGIAVAMSVYMGTVQFGRSIEKYSADGYVSAVDVRDASIDSTMVSLYEFTHKLTRGMDDIFFGWIDKISGGDPYSELSYAEKAAEGYKILFNYIGEKSATLAKKIKNVFKSGVDTIVDSVKNMSKGVVIQGDKNNNLIEGGNKNDTLKGGAGNDLIFGNGGKDWIYGENGNDSVNGGSGNDYLSGGNGTDTLKGDDGKDTLIGGNGNDILIGDKGNDSLLGGEGIDTLNGGKGNDILTGGEGKDIFVYAAGDGNDIITDYTAKQDKIQITSGSVTKTSYKNDDIIFTVKKGIFTSGTLTVKDGKNKKITFIDSSGKNIAGTVSSKNISKFWFIEEQSNFNDSTRLDSIVKMDVDSSQIGVDFMQNSVISTEKDSTMSYLACDNKNYN